MRARLRQKHRQEDQYHERRGNRRAITKADLETLHLHLKACQQQTYTEHQAMQQEMRANRREMRICLGGMAILCLFGTDKCIQKIAQS